VLQPYLHRRVLESLKSDIDPTSDVFVKPSYEIKAFTGFCLQASDAYNLEEYAAVPENTPCWVVDRVRFVSELRYYVARPGTAPYGRYDDGDDDAPLPDTAIVDEMADLLWQKLRHPFAMDVGVLSTGETALIEMNDAWAIGLYKAALSPLDYYKFLRARWDSVLCEIQLLDIR